jgi:hypothetical protein
MTFNESIKALQAMQNSGAHIAEVYPNGNKRYTQEYLDMLAIAQKLNPNHAPVGFYLD